MAKANEGGASLMHLDISSGKSTPEKYIAAEDFSMQHDLTSVTPVPEKRFVILRLVKKRRGRVWIDGIANNILNPNTKRRERVYLLNGADSIWQSDLIELLKDKDYYRRNRRSLLFENSICRIPIEDERAIEFSKVCPYNVGKNRTGSGKYDFYEYDALEEQKARAEKQNFKLKTVLKVNEMGSEQVKKLAGFLGIKFVDDIGMPIGEEGVKNELLILADTRPEVVAKYIDSREVDVAWLVRKALTESLIDISNNNAIWASGKGFIAKIPSARKPYEFLIELAMNQTVEDGRKFLEQLKQIVG